MKKVLYILIIIVLLFVLSGCNKYRYNKFNENLEFDEELNGEEYVELIKKVVEKWKDFSKMKIKVYSHVKLNSESDTTEGNCIVKSYTNSLIEGKAITKSNKIKGGVKTKNEYSSEIYYWDYKEDNAIIKRSTASDITKYESSSYNSNNDNPFDYVYNDFFNELLVNVVALNKTKAYKTNNGYVFIYSQKDPKEVVLEYPSKTEKSIRELQTIYIVNKKYEITKILYYYQNITERYMNDDLNNSFEDHRAMEIKISYGKRRENLKLEEKLNNEYKEYKEGE